MERDWYKLAAQAKAAIGDVKAPGVMSRREAAAASLGLARQTLRNYISAHDFVQRVSENDPELAVLLRGMPSLAAEIYNRWWAQDEAGAAAHARLAIRNGLTVREIVAAHKNSARPKDHQAGILRDLVAAWRSSKPSGQIRPDIEAAFRRQHLIAPTLDQLRPERCEHPLARAVGIDTVLVPSGPHPRGAIALLEVPGLALSDGMRRQWRAVLAKSLAAAHFFPLVIVLAPTSNDLSQLVENIPFASDPVQQGGFDYSSSGQLARALARSAAPRVLDAGDHGGGVLFSSGRTFFQDYYAG